MLDQLSVSRGRTGSLSLPPHRPPCLSAVLSLLHRFLLLALLSLSVSSTSSAALYVSVGIAPPPLPVYVQPVCPGPGYIWVPGYWAYGPDDYYWVPGVWVLTPFIGALWTPGYWDWDDGGRVYLWRDGYWARHVGFYGGIDYGFGYFGIGFVGGRWNNGVFDYNVAVSNVVNIQQTYNQPVAQPANVSRVSFHGGTGGIARDPTAAERLAQRDSHRPMTATQVQAQRLARVDRRQWASVNHGTPAIAALPGVATTHRNAAVPGSQRTAKADENARSAEAAQHARPHDAQVTSTHRPQANRQTSVERAQAHAPGAHARVADNSTTHTARHEPQSAHARTPQADRQASVERAQGHAPGGQAHVAHKAATDSARHEPQTAHAHTAQEVNRQSRAETRRTPAQSGQAGVTHNATPPSAPHERQANREVRVERPQVHAAPEQPRVATVTPRAAPPEPQAAHVRTPQVDRETRVEHPAARAQPARPELPAQTTMRSGAQSEMHAQVAPNLQSAGQAPHAEPPSAHQGNERRQEEPGGR